MSAKYIIIIEQPLSSGGHIFLPLTDEDGNMLHFDDAAGARAAATGTMWEHAWRWWVVELREGGRVREG